jgi:hypothetical protein
MDKIQKLGDSESYTPSSEHFRINSVIETDRAACWKEVHYHKLYFQNE